LLCIFSLQGGFAVAIPRLDLFISLVGAFGSSFLSLIFPPLVNLIMYWPNVSKTTLVKNSLVILFGLVGFSTGTYASIHEIFLALK